jgi:hypothetical protein
MSGRHMTDDEIVGRVFPVEEGPAPIPIHLAVCPECQQRVAKLRDAFLLDRGVVTGVVESLPGDFWSAQRRAILGRITELSAVEVEQRATPFPARFTKSVLHRPALALGSLAAALALVAGISVLRGGTENRPSAGVAVVAAAPTSGPAELSAADREDDELLRSVDSALSGEASQEALLPEVMR